MPARQVEPYRLWFEFLKLAHIDPEIHVDYDHYADWGPFWEMSFNHWWSGARWRGLFAVLPGCGSWKRERASRKMIRRSSCDCR